jgi:HPt (histidine-containing phosphotransfer) domain-containing protein
MAKVPHTRSESPAHWTPTRMLARLDGDRGLAVQLAGIFIDEYPNMLQRLRDAVTAGSADDVRRAAHALKGSISNFIDGGPTATAYELETMGRKGQLDGTRPLLDRLDRELIELTVCLREFQSKGAGSTGGS